MMCVPVSVEVSPLHGLGLFAFMPIPAGTPLWRYADTDQRLPLDASTCTQKHYGYVNPRNPDKLVICGDHSRYWNFGADRDASNAVEGPVDESGEAVIVSARDIKPGEELLIDQSTDADAGRKMS